MLNIVTELNIIVLDFNQLYLFWFLCSWNNLLFLCFYLAEHNMTGYDTHFT